MFQCYLGAYTSGDNSGISLLNVDESGFKEPPRLVASMENPTWLLKAGAFLLAVSETGHFSPDGQGGVFSFRVQPDGSLCPVHSAASGGAGPCHLTWMPKHGLVFASNYLSGTLGVLRLREDGTLEACETFVHHGSGPRPEQEGAHIHCAVPTADESRLFVCDLGSDRVSAYTLDEGENKLVLCGEILLPPGSGPRHAILSPNERHLYILCELSRELYTYDWATGRLSPPLPVASVPPGAFAAAAAIRISASGTSLATSCRGVDCLRLFALAPDGALSAMRTLPCEHRFPRDFSFLPGSNRLALVAYEKSDCLELWNLALDSPVLAQIASPRPVAVCWT